MNNINFATVLIVAYSTIALLAGSSKAQAETVATDPLWPFHSEQKMDEAIVKYSSDPLATYYVIMRALEIHKAAEATLEYRALVKSRPNDPYLQSAYAFAQSMAYSELSFDWTQATPAPAVAKARSLQMEAQWYGDMAYASKPSDPYILLERGVEMECSFANQNEAAIQCLKKAAKFLPKWAPTHFWLAGALSTAAAMSADPTIAANESIAEFELSAQLDPKLKAKALMGESGPFSLEHKYGAAVQCIDESIALDPTQAVIPQMIKVRKELETGSGG